MSQYSILLLAALHKRTALRLTKTLTDCEVNVIIGLYTAKQTASYRVLMRSMHMHSATFHTTIKSLLHRNYITFLCIGRRKFFSLTPSGRLILFQFASALDKIVQEKLKEFGGNDESL